MLKFQHNGWREKKFLRFQRTHQRRCKTLDETGAEFQNLKFPDLRHKIQPADGGGPKADAVRNDF